LGGAECLWRVPRARGVQASPPGPALTNCRSDAATSRSRSGVHSSITLSRTSASERLGKVTQVFTFVSEREVDGCLEITGDDLWTMISDPESTFMTHEVYLNCTPGASADSPGNRLHSFGNPVTAQGTFVISGGTGVFEGASGSGTLYLAGAGDTLVIRYDGTITI
jgi:hypothetical protein